jgi:dienelactone hydrolase
MGYRPPAIAAALVLCGALAAAAAPAPAPSPSPRRSETPKAAATPQRAAAAPASAPPESAAPAQAAPLAPPDGTYAYAISRDGTDQGTTTVVLSRRPGQNVIESDEVGVIGAARARIVAAYRFDGLVAESYVATYQAPFLRSQPLGRESPARPSIPFDAQTTVRFHIDLGVARATIDTVDGVFVHPVSAADVPSPRPADLQLPKRPFILDGPFMTGYLMLPAYRHLTNETAVTPVSEAFPPDPPFAVERIVRARPSSKVPGSDIALELPGLATLWYDPRTMVVHEVYLEGYNLDARLVSAGKGGGLPNLASGPAATPVPELASQPVPFAAQDGTRLSGVRSAPSGAKLPSAVLFIGPPVPEPATRDYSEMGPDPMFPALARALVGRGYVVMRYDERGTGRSAGAFDQLTWEQSLGDAGSALTALLASGGVDPKHVYLLGYGSGADLALALAGESRGVAGVVALGPSIVSYREAAARRRAAHEPAPAPTAFFSGGRKIAPNQAAWERSSFGHDPVALAARTRVPLFVLHSGVVAPARTPQDVERYDDRLRASNPRATVLVANDLSEHFGGRYDADSPENTEVIFPYRFDPSTAGAIADWLDEVKANPGESAVRSSHEPPPGPSLHRLPPPPPGNVPILSRPMAKPTVLPGQLIVPGANTIPLPPSPSPTPAR